MLHKSLLALPVLLLGASCVPPVVAGQGVASPGTMPASRAAAAALPLPSPEAIAPGRAAEPFVLGRRSERDIDASLQCLTAAVYYEARSESPEGQRAVAQVVLNRVRHPAFPKTVCGVVYQGSNRRTGCQFSFTCDGSLRARREPAAWARARHVAATALAGGVYGPVGVATHYHTTAIRPWWAASLRRAVTVGSHIFYRWRGDWGDPKSFRRPYLAAEATERAARTAPNEPPEQRQRQAAAPAFEGEVIGTAFGVTIRRGAPPTRAAAVAKPEPEPRPEKVAGVRIHVGLPDFAAAAAEPAAPTDPVPGIPAR
ncbi:MAG TPA: cell wall hydrolase [Allosphingosinicella sp.]|nr:cell wall hydrolase [Allosphingosinicella sp.]